MIRSELDKEGEVMTVGGLVALSVGCHATPLAPLCMTVGKRKDDNEVMSIWKHLIHREAVPLPLKGKVKAGGEVIRMPTVHREAVPLPL